jgi:hypothetical protein
LQIILSENIWPKNSFIRPGILSETRKLSQIIYVCKELYQGPSFKIFLTLHFIIPYTSKSMLYSGVLFVWSLSIHLHIQSFFLWDQLLEFSETFRDSLVIQHWTLLILFFDLTRSTTPETSILAITPQMRFV